MITNPNDGNTPRVEIALPEITVSSAGLITATSEQAAGYVPGGTKSSTKQLTTQAAKTVTPGTTNQTAVASGRYTTGAVTVKGDANLKAENIAEGVSIFGVTGTLSGGGDLSYREVDRVTFWEQPAGYDSTNIILLHYDGSNSSLGTVEHSAALAMTGAYYYSANYCERITTFRYVVYWPAYVALEVRINDYETDIATLRSNLNSEYLIPGFNFKYYLCNR